MTERTLDFTALETRKVVAGVTPMAQPLRVMHLLLKFGFGGSEGGVLKLANGFDRDRIRPSICSCLPADAITLKLAPDVPLFEVGRRRGNDFGFVLRLARLLRAQRPHILHTHGWATLVEGLVAGRLAGVPLIVHGEHGTLETRERNLVLQRWLWKRVDRVLSVSSLLADRMANTVGFPVDRITTIRNGVDLERFSPERRAAGRAALGFAEEDIVIGTVGRMLPVKDHRSFIAAIQQVRQAGRRVRALIVGDGPLREETETFANSMDLSPALTLLGNRVDVETVLASFDIFVSSSLSEGLSNTILEAMATGVPVVATEVGGTRELVVHNHTGRLVPPANPSALAAALVELIADPVHRRTLGQAGRQRVLTEFELAGMVRQYESLYQHLAAERGIGVRR